MGLAADVELWKWLTEVPRIHDCNAKVLEVRGVAGGNGQVVNFRRAGDKRVAQI